MILVDANLLLYAYDAASPRHADARRWWEERLSQSRPVGLAWVTLVAYLRIGTHPRVFEQPLSLDEAREHVRSWLGRPMVRTVSPGERHWEILDDLLHQARATGNLVTDAHLAALAIEHGAVLCSTDRDFARFENLEWTDPLSP